MNPRLPACLLILFLLSGCATVRETVDRVIKPSPANRLDAAIAMIEKNDSAGAMSLLESVTNDNSKPGVTDEALFRLALLQLKGTVDRDSALQPLRMLERLQRDYPESPWTAQSTPLRQMLATIARRGDSDISLRRQVKSLKEQNLSIIRENQELRQTIDRLKRLDLELERGR